MIRSGSSTLMCLGFACCYSLVIFALTACSDSAGFSSGDSQKKPPPSSSDEEKPEKGKYAEKKKSPTPSSKTPEGPEDTETSDQDASNSSEKPDIPDNAITKGSFTVYTVPNDPQPAEYYFIHIVIQFEEVPDTYGIKDLTYRIDGTDGYTNYVIKGEGSPDQKPARFHFDKNAKNAHIEIRIPGGWQLVKDTIYVESEVLKENQTIEIIF